MCVSRSLTLLSFSFPPTSTTGALCYAELGTMIPKSGAEFPYLYDTYGEPIAFLFSWVSILLTRPSSVSIIALTFAQYAVQPFYPEDECEPPSAVLKMMACVCVSKLLTSDINSLFVPVSKAIFFFKSLYLQHKWVLTTHNHSKSEDLTKT